MTRVENRIYRKARTKTAAEPGSRPSSTPKEQAMAFPPFFRLKGARAWPRTGASISGAIMGSVRSPPDSRQAVNTGRKPLPMSSARHSSPIFQPQ